jgi:Protein of unknown function (DUF3800)
LAGNEVLGERRARLGEQDRGKDRAGDTAAEGASVNQEFNIYCDESCHLEHDGSNVMVLGSVWCPRDKVREIAERIRELKRRNKESPDFELKWSRISPSREQLYCDVVDYFFDDGDLHFRSIIVPKDRLVHRHFSQDHDTFYYKMYFLLLRELLSPRSKYAIYLDIKDTRSSIKREKLREVLCNNMYDFDKKVIERIQTVRSHEVEQLQVADLLIGAVASANRDLTKSPAKLNLLSRVRKRSGYGLTRSTLLREEKFNVFRWEPQRVEDAD